ncbi:GNAT family N-acetyltransferase [Cognatiyoonia sp. IB215182]|uniref:GNAT family N-acetyltransferase n=1 Tax=Cognatiyoonia sp. IB215182 TaxID=3097353 RepID=UPI002A0BCF2A|nr:GNAT family N-acetyltransferase [Cognatiyoonia sp. IB215182]MDX8352155.1 GNAT family N-acetyltransferase [Cognatiyoonia sp. IB215182]
MAGNTAAKIRPLRSTDRSEWEALWTGYLEFYGTSVTPEVYEATFKRLLGTDAQDYNCLIAEMDGKPVGLAHYLFHRHCWRIENVCYLQDLYAAPEARGLGVGRKLIEAVYAAADAAGAAQVYWTTEEDNHVGRRLYDRIGQVTKFIKYQRPA